MANYELVAAPFLGGFEKDFDGTILREVSRLDIISIAEPLGGRPAMSKVVKSALGTKLPVPGSSEKAAKSDTRIMGMGPDQFMAVLAPTMSPAAAIEALGSAAYCTDQSHSWVGLHLSGAMARPALERVCPIDIDPKCFPVGSVARTSMEHLGAIIIAEDREAFLLLSASSSAKSFLHVIETSIRNCI